MGSEQQPEAKSDISLDSIKVPDLPKPSEAVREYSDLEAEHYKTHTTGLKQDIAERKTYAYRIFVLICCWLIAVFLLLIAEGFAFHGFALSNAVVLAVIGSTTVNVLGIFYIVTHYLFPKR